MMSFTKVLAGAAVVAAIASAAPASAQYYPNYGYGYGYPSGGNVVGQVLNNVLGGGYGYGANSQVAVNQCAAAVQARLGRYGGPSGYAGGRVLGISRVEPRGDGGLRVRGVATTGYNGQPDLTFSCKTDSRGFIRDINVDRAYRTSNYGYPPSYGNYGAPPSYGNYGAPPSYGNYDYSQYGYRRY